MKRRFATTLAAACLTLAAAAAETATLEETLAKHTEARGGLEAWESIDSMRITGTFTGFSKESTFTVHRKRGNLYHLDHVQGDLRVVVGYDGETAWWDNRYFREGAMRMSGADLAVVERDVELIPPLLVADRLGAKLELLDQSDLDGEPVVAIQLTREDESVETYYLNPATHLELARDSPGSDFGRPMTQRTYYDDFREVAGVMVPYYTETQWYTRHRVFAADDVEVNVDFDNSIFGMPPPVGMAELHSLIGDWEVKVEDRQSPQAPWSESSRRSTVRPLARGALLQEEFQLADGSSAVRTLSYDQFRERYRLTSIDEQVSFLDVQEGVYDDEGRLVLSNLDTKTTLDVFGRVIFTRTSVVDVGGDGFRLEREQSFDEGENWMLVQKLTYSRSVD